MKTAHDDNLLLPVFPLPNVVLFPHTVLPLHIFEGRYREMVRDAGAGDGRIVITLLKPGFESAYEGAPQFHPLGTIGRIEDLRPLEDGRFLLNLVGTERVALEEIPSEKPYRLVRALPRPEAPVDESDPELGRKKLELLATLNMLMRELGAEDAASVVLDDGIAFEFAVNGCCANLPADGEQRQELLAIDELGLRAARAARLVDRALRDVIEQKSAEGDRPPLELN